MKTFFTFFILFAFCTGLGCQKSGSETSLSVDSGYINVDGGKLFYESAGSGETIILLHDGMVHREIWNDQFSLLAKNYRVIRYDRRGYGKSSDPEKPYSAIQDLNQVFIQQKIKNAIIFGMSSGGSLAINFTLKYPEKVTALVLVGAVVGGLGYTSHMVTRGGNMDINLDFNDVDKVHNYFITDDPYEIYSENRNAKEKVMELMKANRHLQKNNSLRFEERADRDAVKNLSEINIPALILVGEFDIPDVHAHAGAINAGIKNSVRKIIPKSGHLIPIEQPGLFDSAVKDFLADLYFMNRSRK